MFLEALLLGLDFVLDGPSNGDSESPSRRLRMTAQKSDNEIPARTGLGKSKPKITRLIKIYVHYDRTSCLIPAPQYKPITSQGELKAPVDFN